MPLKLRKSQTPSEPSSLQEDWSGPWGRINSTSERVEVVRFCQRPDRAPEQTHSYPYRVISAWRWIDHFPEELKIEAGADVITVKGRGLDRIAEALNQGSLEFLREVPFAPSTAEDHVWISSITIEAAQKH